jgi:hypothetical protein
VPADVSLTEYVPPFPNVEEEVNFGPLTYVTLWATESWFVHTIVCPTLACRATGLKAMFCIVTGTELPAGGVLERGVEVVAGELLELDELDELDEPQAASVSATNGTARTDIRFMVALLLEACEVGACHRMTYLPGKNFPGGPGRG